jgi:PKD repeat protein
MVALGGADISILNTGEKMKTDNKKLILTIALVALVSCMIAPVNGWATANTYVFDDGIHQNIPALSEPNISLSQEQLIVGKYLETAYYACHVEDVTSSFQLSDYCTRTFGGDGDQTQEWECATRPPNCGVGDTARVVFAAGAHDWTYHPYGTIYINEIGVVAPVSSFSCTPTSQYPDTSVVCTDTSTNTPTDWYWTIDMEGAGIEGWQTHTGQNFTWDSHYPGLYSVNLRANNSAGSDWENKTNYVSISSNATPNFCNQPVVPGYIRSMAQCVDSQTSGAIHGCAISLLDKEGGAWSNTSNAQGGTHCIDTLPGHHIDAYGSATGYTSTYRTDLPVSDTLMYELIMVPGYVPPAASGKVWLYVLVNDQTTGAAISGATVSISGTGQTTQTGTTDNVGTISKQWANASTAYVTAAKTGYNTGSKTVVTSSFGPDTIRIELNKGIVTPTATATAGPGGTVAPTLAPGKNADGTYQAGYTNMQGQEMMNWLAENGMALVQLCFLVTVFALLGIKFGK